MGSLFRSEEMALCQLFLQSESAYACLSELGELGLVQFRDLNPDVNAFQRKFVDEVRRCDDMERTLRYLSTEMKKDGIPVPDTNSNFAAPQPREMVELETTLEQLEKELREVNQNALVLKRNFHQLIELKYILRKAQDFFYGQENAGFSSTESNVQIPIGDDNTARQSCLVPVHLGSVAGVILRERIPAFERMLWRVCHGNALLRLAEIVEPLEDPTTGEQVYKSIFIIFFHGNQLETRVKKICDGFRATVYNCPEDARERREMATGVMSRIKDLQIVLGQTQELRSSLLVSAARQLKSWFMKVRKIKAIYHTLNMFNLDVTQKCLIAECWVPIPEIESIQYALRRGTERSGSSIPAILNKIKSCEDPPTYNRTNKFTSGFQALIDAYGVASYKEMNPAPYTIITFPFLFAVMFGDSGHGLIMLSFAAWMVYYEKPLEAKKLSNEIWNIFFAGRYIILLMGLFSVYTGLIYNDVFSKSLNIFGSSWKVNYNFSTLQSNKHLQLDPKSEDYDKHPYPFGMDPVWQLADNKIIFLNSYKMKISIIFGVMHMLFGIVVGLWNHLHFKRKIDIFCDFIPKIIFMLFLFFYMVCLMFIKWIKYSADAVDEKDGSFCAPSILITFINMMLFRPNVAVSNKCDANMYSGQEILQKILVILAIICIPWMLLIKPLIINFERKKRDSLLENQRANNEDIEEATGSQQQNGQMQSANIGKEEEQEEQMSEVFIDQAIHTIEYVLGSISHTASYLRLWALSLAHAQLSEVLWNQVMRRVFSMTKTGPGGFVLWIVFAFWAVLTISILVLMEGLSAFLHTLRLHWVEFQSKFYSGIGYGFQPFSFKVILNSAEATGED